MTIKKIDTDKILDVIVHDINDNFDTLVNNLGAISKPPGVVGYKGVCVDDGVEVSLDSIIVRMNTASPRSLQFKLSSGTMSVNISGVIYWTNNGNANWGANYWQSKTLNTTWQQPFGWDFPWASDNAVYNVQDLTNKRLYRITLSVGPGYKGNFIVMERLV